MPLTLATEPLLACAVATILPGWLTRRWRSCRPPGSRCRPCRRCRCGRTAGPGRHRPVRSHPGRCDKTLHAGELHQGRGRTSRAQCRGDVQCRKLRCGARPRASPKARIRCGRHVQLAAARCRRRHAAHRTGRGGAAAAPHVDDVRRHRRGPTRAGAGAARERRSRCGAARATTAVMASSRRAGCMHKGKAVRADCAGRRARGPTMPDTRCKPLAMPACRCTTSAARTGASRSRHRRAVGHRRQPRARRRVWRRCGRRASTPDTARCWRPTCRPACTATPARCSATRCAPRTPSRC